MVQKEENYLARYSTSKQEETEEAPTKISKGTNTSDDGSLLEAIMEGKPVPQKEPDTTQTPSVEELKKETPSIKASAYHHPHHLARFQSARQHVDRVFVFLLDGWCTCMVPMDYSFE